MTEHSGSVTPNSTAIPLIQNIFGVSADFLGQLRTWLEQNPPAIPVTQIIGFNKNTVTLYKLSAAPVSVTNTTTETTLLSEQIPGSQLGTTGALRATLNMDVVNSGAAGRTFTFKVKFGGTSLYGDAILVPNDSAKRGIRLEFVIGNLGATNVNFLEGEFRLSNNGVPTVAGLGSIGTNDDRISLILSNGTTAVDTSITQPLMVTVTADTALSTWTLHGQNYMIEFL